MILQIAEGSAKSSDKDFNRYLGIALGSGNETAPGLDVAFEEHLIHQADFLDALNMNEMVVNQLGSFSKKLKLKA